MTIKTVGDVRVFHKAVEKVAPIAGVSYEGRIDFLPEATDAEKAAAQAIYDNWSYTPPDWEAFGADFEVLPEYIRIKSATPQAIAMSNTLEARIMQASSGINKLPNIKKLWDLIADQANPTTAEITTINALLATHKIDQFFTLDSAGHMQLSGL